MNINPAMLHPNDYYGDQPDEEEPDGLYCPLCGSHNVTISEVYELGDLAWCHTCRYSFRPDEEQEEEDSIPTNDEIWLDEMDRMAGNTP